MQSSRALAREVLSAVLEFVKEVWKTLWKQVIERAAGETVTVITLESLKLAVKAAWECTKGAMKQAILMGLLVDGGLLTFKVCYSGWKYKTGKIDGYTFRQEVLCHTTTAVGSFVGGAVGITGGAFIGGFIGSFFPVIGTSFGAMIGATIGAIIVGTAGSYAGKKIGKEINKKLA